MVCFYVFPLNRSGKHFIDSYNTKDKKMATTTAAAKKETNK